MFSPEFRLLLVSCRLYEPDCSEDEARALLVGGNIDWDRLYSLAAINSVRPQLAKLIGKIEKELVHDYFKARINKDYHDNTYDQISYAAEFIRINSMMEEAGVTIVPFKGFWLAHEYYGNLGDREAGDIDVFTDFSKLPEIKDMMLADGYQVEERMADYSIDDLLRKAGEYNFDKIYDGRSVSHFEFHWRISSPVYGIGISPGELEAQVTQGTLQQQRVKVFNPSADFLLSVLHHGGKDPFNRLKFVLDFAFILEKHEEIDWTWVRKIAGRYNAVNLIYVAVCLAHELLATPIPPALKNEAASKRIRRLTRNRIRFMTKSMDYWHPRIFINDWLFRIRSRSGLKIKVRLAFYVMCVLLRRLKSDLLTRS